MDLPVTATTIIVSRRITSLPGVATLSGWEISGRSVVRPTIGIRVWRRRAIVPAVGVIVTTTRRWRWRRIVVHRTAWGRPIASALVVVSTRAALTVAITVATRATITSWRTAAVIIIEGRHWAAAATRRTGSSTLARRHVWLRISYALDCLSLELKTIELLYSGLEISGCLELHESSAIGVAASLGVDHVKARLTGKVFEILHPGPRKSLSGVI
jgi:hypothetical protein